MAERSLRELAIEYGTDKQGAHAYADRYDHHFRHLRHRPITVLEIGVGGYADPHAGGESLRMWKAYFSRARIVGFDLHDKSALAEDRIEILQGDQGDPAFLAALGARYGRFDLVIDDGSHLNAHVIASFQGLFPYLAEEGIYAIEDLQTSYWERRYGGSSREDRRGTSMSFLHELADGLNYAELDVPNYQPTLFDVAITSVTFYHNLAFIQRGRNDEPSNFLPPHPRPATVYAAVTSGTADRSSGVTKPRRKGGSPARRLVRRVLPEPVRRRLRALLGRGRPARE